MGGKDKVDKRDKKDCVYFVHSELKREKTTGCAKRNACREYV